MLPPGTYEAAITGVEETTGFNDDTQVCVTYGAGGQSIRQWVTAELGDPDNKGTWIFWKLVGALDYPTQEYWETPAGEREAREWNPLEDLRQCMEIGRTVLLTVESYSKKSGGMATRVSSSKLASPRRNPGAATHTGPAETTVEPKGFIANDDVPF